MAGYAQTLSTAQAAGAAVTGTAITTLLPTSALYFLPGGSLKLGDRLIIQACGQQTTIVTTPGTTTFTVRFGPTANISVFASQAMALNIVAQTNATWVLRLQMTCRAVGSGTVANFITVGEFTSRTTLNAPAVGTTTGVGTVLLPDTAPAVGTGFDSTVGSLIDLQVTNSVASSITLMEYELTHRTWTP
jgi:hypothetical protein